MAMSDLDYIRLKLSLPHRLILQENLGEGDGVTKKFKLQLAPVIAESETIRVDETAQTRTTHYAIDDALGLITFVAAPADGDTVDADYTWSVFSDVQIIALMARYNDEIVPTMLDLIHALLSNSDLFIKYTIGMETIDRSAALDALLALQESFSTTMAGPMGQAVIWKEADYEETERDVPWGDFLDSIPED